MSFYSDDSDGRYSLYSDEMNPSEWKNFPTPYQHSRESPYTAHELKMIEWSYFVRSTKQNWEIKVQDSVIRAKWKQEILDQQIQKTRKESETDKEEQVVLSEKMVDYVLDELADHAQSNPQGIRASCFDRIYESDTLIPLALQAQLSVEVAKLEAGEKDWHPNTHNQVLDLVHPSLWPIRYGHTLVHSPDSDELIIIANPPPMPQYQRAVFHSEKYQWLATDFLVSEEGQVKIDGYINNLHPELHHKLYSILAQIFQHFLPLYERVLTSLQHPPPHRVSPHAGVYDFRSRMFSIPNPSNFQMPPESKEPRFTLNGRTLQAIVKIGSIILTPEKPTYEGGGFHVEGMQNENIVASGIYYWDQENIGESRLEFRGQFNDKNYLDPDDEQLVQAIYNIEQGAPCTQNLNSLSTTANRCIAFPNIYQHRVSPFSLLDPIKPGHRKILCFFLIDPLRPVPSTKTIAPQQRDWIAMELEKVEKLGKLPKLPIEVWEMILNEMGLMSFDEAKEVRIDLMHERKFVRDNHTNIVFERPYYVREFSLCEH